ncbi:lipopolysaccharide biosynthesis protein [Pseudogracilibacillus auburnensis]|uniref:lipopolysaccharide biosynthesis protein n=1 Tax=Pseudogracilibacillus auburnensis TaxID=1494959 RepID=UPI001A95AAB5|nr:oligosaccharide flippase family protein [Pseudogracilibacillus auburnensis]MBO1001497.1 oligosaccharide flippase family protein [Pseudogracilibacillus auburnensis]
MKNKLLRSWKITDSDFIKSVAVLMSGTILSQITLVLVTPLLTRMYGPEQFGVFAVYTSILFTISVITSLHYETAIPLPKKDNDAVHVLVVALLILCGNVLVLSLIIISFRSHIVHLFQFRELTLYLSFLPVSILGLGTFQVFQLWALRKEAYPRIAQSKVKMNLSQICSQLGLGIFSNTAGFLIAGEVLGRIIGGFSLAFSSRKDFKGKRMKFRWEKLKVTAIRYKHFPLISSWSSVFAGFSAHLPILFIASSFGVKVAGWYLVATRVLALPDALLGYSVKQVYLAKSAKILHISFSDFVKLFWNTVTKLFLIALVIFVSLAIVSPIVFPFIFGDAWGEAGKFVQYLSILYFFQLIVGPISPNFYVLELLHIQVFAEAFRLIILVLGIVCAYFFLTEPWQVILTLSVFGTIGFIMLGIGSWYTMYLKLKSTRKANIFISTIDNDKSRRSI